LSGEQKVQIVLAILAGELTVSVARAHTTVAPFGATVTSLHGRGTDLSRDS
jgi:hypothetical protein